jgi:hypothetical protein
MFVGSGHESWIAVVLFGGMFALRYAAAQRRRGGARRGGPSAGFFNAPGGRPGSPPTGPPVGTAVEGGTAGNGGDGGPGGTAPGWFRDPFFRHEHRYWSGSEWTEHVTDADVPGVDPPPPPRSPGA